MFLMKLFYKALWIKQRATLGVQIAVVREGTLLLVRHTYKAGWRPPGGGVEPPEAPQATIVRELFEETGCRLFSPPRLIGVTPNVSKATKRDYIVAYSANDAEMGSLQQNSEIAEVAWFALDELPEDRHPMVDLVLEETTG